MRVRLSHISYDARQCKQYQVKIQVYRSVRFATLPEAASDLLEYVKASSARLLDAWAHAVADKRAVVNLGN